MSDCNGIKVCHITSAHNRYDVRIFEKECQSLSRKGYNVSLVVNDELDDEYLGGVNIISTGFKPQNRFDRFIGSSRRLRKIAEKLDADVYHLHDSELLLMVKHLKSQGKTVVFDSHEDYLYAIDDKRWIPNKLKKIIKRFYNAYEKSIIKKVDAAIVCYHWTEERFNNYCKKVKMVLNYPIVDEGAIIYNRDFSRRSIGFAGLISEIWSHKEIIQACSELENIKYELAGRKSVEYWDSLINIPGWELVNYHGVLPPSEVYEAIYSQASVGVALLDYISLCRSTVGNLSNTKIFEIMFAGLPLLCTNFLLWKEIVDCENCGFYVNPHNIEEIKAAIEKLFSNPKLAQEMGENGRKAVIEKYNWGKCEIELFDVYDYLELNCMK